MKRGICSCLIFLVVICSSYAVPKPELFVKLSCDASASAKLSTTNLPSSISSLELTNAKLTPLFKEPSDPVRKARWEKMQHDRWFVLNWDNEDPESKYNDFAIDADVKSVILAQPFELTTLPDDYLSEEIDAHHTGIGLWYLDHLQCPQAWSFHQNSDDVIIAIIDSGLDSHPTNGHQDIVDNVYVNPGEDIGSDGLWTTQDNNGIDDDGNGKIDDISGWDFVNQPLTGGAYVYPGEDNLVEDQYVYPDIRGHGTNCAGAASAVTNNGYGVASPAWNAKILPLKVAFLAYNSVGDLTDYVSSSRVFAAVDYAIELGVDIISLSMALESNPDSEHGQLIQEHMTDAYLSGIVVVAAAGNSHYNNNEYRLVLPAGCDNVISVAALDTDDSPANFTYYHETVDISAPGVSIWTTCSEASIQTPDVPGFFLGSGTSIAAPVVASVAAQLLSIDPTLTPNEVETAIEAGANNIDNLCGGIAYGMGAGEVNLFKAILATPSEKTLEEDLTITRVVYDGAPFYGTPYTIGGPIIVPDGITLTIEEDVTLIFETDEANITVEDGGVLIIEAGVMLDFATIRNVDNTNGIFIKQGGKLYVQGTTVNPVNMQGNWSLSQAIQLDGGYASIDHLEIEYAGYLRIPITLSGTSRLSLRNSVIQSWITGVVISGSSYAGIVNTLFTGEVTQPITITGTSSLHLEDSEFEDTVGRAINSTTSGKIALKCNIIHNHEQGPSLHTFNSHVALASPPQYLGGWGGNAFYDTWYSGPQLSFNFSTVTLKNGMNRIEEPDMGAGEDDPSLMFLDNVNDGTPIDISGNYWGYDYTGAENSILNRITTDDNAAVDEANFTYNTSWTFCSQDYTPTVSSCKEAWERASKSMDDGDFSAANNYYKNIVENFQDCEFAKPAAEQILITSKLDSIPYDTLKTYLLARAAVSSNDLSYALLKTAAEARTLVGEYEYAIDELDSLVEDDSTGTLDSIACLMAIANVEYLQDIRDDESASGRIEYYMELINRANELMALVVDTTYHAPILTHTRPDPISAAYSTASLSVYAHECDEIPIDTIWITYRFEQDESWSSLGMIQTDDTTWSVDIGLGYLGGGIRYKFEALDTLGRWQTWPSINGRPTYDNDLFEFISFEPRPTGHLQDTAYVYCPGVITENLSLARGGVLYVLPSPVDEPHILVVDSGYVIEGSTSYGGEGIEPEIHFVGTEYDTIVVLSTGGDDRWQGCVVQNGLIEASYTTMANVLFSGFCAFGGTILQLEHCAIEDGTGYAIGVFLSQTSATGDTSSYLDDVYISHVPTGLKIVQGTAAITNTTIRVCSTGVALVNTDGQVLGSCSVTECTGHCIYFDPSSTDPDFEVRLENCTITGEGDDVPEIYIPDEGLLDMSDNAGNTISDDEGALISVIDSDALDIELGDNSFACVDSVPPYIKVHNLTSPVYITGNSFFPVPQSDSFPSTWVIRGYLDDWIYTYLRLEDQMETIVAEPDDSIQFSAKVYLEDFVGTVDSDTIVEVGFKYKLLPDSTNWTTKYSTVHEADSLYDFWVQVGDFGGVVEYIWWAKDAHGRYLTSPLGADTAAPGEGNTSFTSFEIVDTTFSADTVTIWAPTVLNHDLLIDTRSLVTIKPWPGATDHTVTFAEGVEIRIYDINAPYGMLKIEGTESMPITIDAVDDTSTWDQIYVYLGTLEAEYTTFRSSVNALNSPTAIAVPTVRLDHCTFESSDGWLLLYNTDIWYGWPINDGSYLRNCVFTDLGTTYGAGSVVIFDGDIEITDCWFYGNEGDGLWLYNAGASTISGCNFMSNGWSGMSSGSVVSSVDIECCEFSYNGSDTTAEVLADYSTFDFSDSSFNTFADYSGPLLEGASMASFILDSSYCNFYLYDSTGHYIVTEDETDTMDVSGAYWYPYDPSDPNFQDYFDPDTSRFWEWPFYLAEPAECGDGGAGQSSIEDDWITSSLGSEDMVSGVSSVTPGNANAKYSKRTGKAAFGKSQSKRSGEAAISKTMSSARRKVATADFAAAVRSQRDGNADIAMEQFASFVRAYPDDKRVPQALSRHFISAKAAGANSGLSRYYQSQSERATDPYIKQHAHFLSLEAMLQENNPNEALRGFEDIIANPQTYRDSVMAVIGAMRVHLNHGEFCDLHSRYPENIMKSHREFAEKAMELQHSIHRHDGDNQMDEDREAYVPSEYKLYQNYPNPFNPSTEIRYDVADIVPVKLSIYNILGQHVVTLVDHVSNSGAFRIYWDGKNAQGLDVATGMYIYQLKAGSFTDAKKMLLLK